MKRLTLVLLSAIILMSAAQRTQAQGTTFTYQGLLRDTNGPVNGSVSLQFRIYALALGGVPLWQETLPLVLVSNGVFSVRLGGITPVDETILDGSPRWLGVAINGAPELTPRRQLTATPYAITAGHLTGVLPSNALSGTYSAPVSFNNLANTFTGNGAGLTTLNASRLVTGTVPDTRLSANVARRDTPNTFTGDLTLEGDLIITSGSPGPGKVLTSDATGAATWAALRSNPRVVIVDAAGQGDFTTINAALAAIDPSATNPIVVEVLPGTYVETVWLKSHLHLKGSGRERTFIQAHPIGATSSLERTAITLDQLTNVMISGFTLSQSNTSLGVVGIYDNASSPIIADNTFHDFRGISAGPGPAGGIFSIDSQPTIQRNIFTGAGPEPHAIYLRRSLGHITGNRFRILSADHAGIFFHRSSGNILENIFEDQTGIETGGLLDGFPHLPTIAFNQFTRGSIGIRNASGARIIGNDFAGVSIGIENSARALILANTFTNCLGIHQTAPESLVTTISGNFFQFAPADRGLVIENSSPIVTGNVFDGVGIRVQGGSPVITANQLYEADLHTVSGSPIISANNMRTNTTGSASVRTVIAGSGPVNLQVVTSNLLVNAAGAFFSGSVTSAWFAGNGSALTGIHSLDAPDGSPVRALSVNNDGRVGINLANPLHHLHVGTTLGSNSFNTSTNAIVIEDAIENGRATFLALAGVGGPDATNRVELQMEAVESSRRAVMGTTSEHPVHMRVGNTDTLVLATNRFVGIGTANPPARLTVRDLNHQIAIVDADNANKLWTLSSRQSGSGLAFSEDGNTNRLVIDAGGNVGIANSNPTNLLMVVNARCDGNTWINASDRNLKENFTPIDPKAVLEEVVALPISQWNYKDTPGTTHLGPVAQDFQASFGLGADNRSIATVDANGVALAAIQGLNQKLEDQLKAKDRELQKLRDQNQSLSQRLEKLEQLITNRRF